MRYGFIGEQRFRALQFRLRPYGLRFGRLQRRLVRARIDGEQLVAFFHQLAFLEMDGVDRARHARADLGAIDRDQAAGKFLPLLHFFHDDFGNTHRHRSARRRPHRRHRHQEAHIKDKPNSRDQG